MAVYLGEEYFKRLKQMIHWDKVLKGTGGSENGIQKQI